MNKKIFSFCPAVTEDELADFTSNLSTQLRLGGASWTVIDKKLYLVDATGQKHEVTAPRADKIASKNCSSNVETHRAIITGWKQKLDEAVASNTGNLKEELAVHPTIDMGPNRLAELYYHAERNSLTAVKMQYVCAVLLRRLWVSWKKNTATVSSSFDAFWKAHHCLGFSKTILRVATRLETIINHYGVDDSILHKTALLQFKMSNGDHRNSYYKQVFQ